MKKIIFSISVLLVLCIFFYMSQTDKSAPTTATKTHEVYGPSQCSPQTYAVYSLSVRTDFPTVAQGDVFDQIKYYFKIDLREVDSDLLDFFSVQFFEKMQKDLKDIPDCTKKCLILLEGISGQKKCFTFYHQWTD